jgi:ribosomal-protein-alanine N-acetyltransferase
MEKPPPSHPILETKRLILRRMEPHDIPFLMELWTNPDVTKYMGGPREADWLRRELESSLDASSPDEFDLWPVAEKQTGSLVGDCGLLEKEVEGNPEIELNYVLSPAAWGKGYATEIGRAIIAWAFSAKHLGRVIALIDPDNHASERVAKRLGMRLERKTIRPGGAIRRIYAIHPPETANPDIGR